jgi:hypothetical protein
MPPSARLHNHLIIHHKLVEDVQRHHRHLVASAWRPMRRRRKARGRGGRGRRCRIEARGKGWLAARVWMRPARQQGGEGAGAGAGPRGAPQTPGAARAKGRAPRTPGGPPVPGARALTEHERHLAVVRRLACLLAAVQRALCRLTPGGNPHLLADGGGGGGGAPGRASKGARRRHTGQRTPGGPGAAPAPCSTSPAARPPRERRGPLRRASGAFGAGGRRPSDRVPPLPPFGPHAILQVHCWPPTSPLKRGKNTGTMLLGHTRATHCPPGRLDTCTGRGWPPAASAASNSYRPVTMGSTAALRGREKK